MADEVDSATSLLKEQEIELKNDPILMTDLKFKSKLYNYQKIINILEKIIVLPLRLHL